MVSPPKCEQIQETKERNQELKNNNQGGKGGGKKIDDFLCVIGRRRKFGEKKRSAHPK